MISFYWSQTCLTLPTNTSGCLSVQDIIDSLKCILIKDQWIIRVAENSARNVNSLYTCIRITKLYLILKKFALPRNNTKVYNDESLKASTTDVWHNWAKNELNWTYFIDIKSKGPDWHKFWKINSHFLKVAINHIPCIYVIFGNNMKFISFLFSLMYQPPLIV